MDEESLIGVKDETMHISMSYIHPDYIDSYTYLAYCCLNFSPN